MWEGSTRDSYGISLAKLPPQFVKAPAAAAAAEPGEPAAPTRRARKASMVPAAETPRDVRDVQARILTQTLWLAAIGMAIGTIASWVLARGAGGLLFGVTERDPGTFAGMVVVLTIVAAIAGYLPARRASRIDPMVALRAE